MRHLRTRSQVLPPLFTATPPRRAADNICLRRHGGRRRCHTPRPDTPRQLRAATVMLTELPRYGTICDDGITLCTPPTQWGGMPGQDDRCRDATRDIEHTCHYWLSSFANRQWGGGKRHTAASSRGPPPARRLTVYVISSATNNATGSLSPRLPRRSPHEAMSHVPARLTITNA